MFLKKGGILFLFLAIILIFNHRSGYITAIGLLSIIVFFKVTINTKVDNGAFVLMLYTIFYVGVSSLNGFDYTFSTFILYAVAPIIFYDLGIYIVNRLKTDNYIMMALFVIVTCYCLDVCIVTLKNIINTGGIINHTRVFSFDNAGNSIISATQIGLSMNIGMVGLPMMIIVKNKYLRIGFLCLFIMSIITTFSLLNRTGIVVALLAYIIVIGWSYRNKWKSLILSFFAVGIIIGVLVYLGIINTELIELYSERNEDVYTMGTRTERWAAALKYLFFNPLGWAKYGEVYYIHNMWLDVARISGIIPFLLLSYLAYDSFRLAFRIVRRFNNDLSYMLLGLNVCFFASCFVEPVYGGTHMMLYVLVWGVERRLYINR